MKFIFEVKLKPGHTVEEYADTWVKASEIIQRAPGARGTELHRKIDDPTTLLAIATWESKDARDQREEFLKPDAAMRAVLDAHLILSISKRWVSFMIRNGLYCQTLQRTALRHASRNS